MKRRKREGDARYHTVIIITSTNTVSTGCQQTHALRKDRRGGGEDRRTECHWRENGRGEEKYRDMERGTEKILRGREGRRK
jgi:hypothetical protein